MEEYLIYIIPAVLIILVSVLAIPFTLYSVAYQYFVVKKGPKLYPMFLRQRVFGKETVLKKGVLVRQLGANIFWSPYKKFEKIYIFNFTT